MYATAIIAQQLKLRNSALYTYPGGTIAPLYHECVRSQVQIVCGRAEQGAGFMAIADAQYNGCAAFVAVTSGPGVTNLITCIADAFYDSVPLVVFTGQVGTADLARPKELRQRGFQEVPVPELLSPITKKIYQPQDADTLGEILVEAIGMAESGRPGPVIIDLPMNVQLTELQTLPSAETPTPGVEKNVVEIEPLLERLNSARCPLVLVGGGCQRHVEAVRSLIEKWQIPTVSSVRGLGVLPGGHPLYHGWIGHTGLPWANWALGEADLILVLGSRLDVRQTGTRVELFESKDVVHVDLDATELEHGRFRRSLMIKTDLGRVVGALLAVGRPISPEWQEWQQRLVAEHSRLPLQDYGFGDGVRPDELLQTVNRLTEGSPLSVTCGVGSHQQWAARYIDFDIPRRRYFASAGHGTMGYSLPAAIGIQRLNPDKLVIAIDGDGSFQMNLQELMLIQEYQLPLKILILDNQRLGIVSQFQQITFQADPVTGDFASPDFKAIGRAYGVTCFEMEELSVETVKKWLDFKGAALLHVRIQHDAPVSPMLMGGQLPGDMWYRYPWGQVND